MNETFERVFRRVLNIAIADPTFNTLEDEQKCQLITKINTLVNIVDDYIPTYKEELLDSEKNLAEMEEKIITTFKSFTDFTDINHNNTILTQLKYLCAQRIVAYKYSIWYCNSC